MPPVLPQPCPSVPPVTCVGAQLPQPARVPSVSSSSTQHCGSCLWELEKTFSTHFFACVHLVQQPHLHLGWVHCTSTWLWPTVITTNIISQTILDLLLCSVSDTYEVKVTLIAGWQAQASCFQRSYDLSSLTAATVISQCKIQPCMWLTPTARIFSVPLWSC